MSNQNSRLQGIMNAVDKLIRPFKSVEASNKQLTQRVRETRQSLKGLKQAEKNLAELNTLTESARVSEIRLDRMRQRVQSMALVMSASPSKKQTKALETQQRAISMLESKQSIAASEIARRRAELNQMNISSDPGQAAADIQSQKDQHNAKLEEQKRQLARGRLQQRQQAAARKRYDSTMEMKNTLSNAGNSLGSKGHSVLDSVNQISQVASTYGMEMEGFRSLGVGADVLKDADNFAHGMNIIGSSATDNIRYLREAYSVLGDYHGAKIAAPELARLQFGTQFMSSHGITGENTQKIRDQSPALLKTAELRHQLTTVEDFKESLNLSVQAIAASGGKVLPDDYLAMLKTGGIAAEKMDNKAFYFSMSEIIQQVGGDKAGNLLANARKNSIGSTSSSAAELKSLGLLRQDAVKYDKNGHIQKVKPNALVNQDKYTSDPFNYLMTEVVPRIQQRHPKLDESGMSNAIAKLFPSNAGAELYVTMYHERANIQKQLNTGQSAYGVDQLVNEGAQSLQGQQMDLEAKKRDLYQQMGQEILPLYVRALSSVAAGISKVNTFFREHSTLAKVIVFSATGFGVVAVAISGILTAITSIMGPFALLRLILSSFSGTAGIFSSFGSIIVGAVRGIATVLGVLRAAVLANPILAIITLIAAGALLIWQNWGTLGPKFQAIWQSITQFTFEAWESISSCLSVAWDWLVNLMLNWSLPGLIYKHWDEIKANTLQVWESINSCLSVAWDWLVNLMLNWSLPGLIYKHWDEIKAHTLQIWGTIRKDISSKWDEIVADVTKLPAKFKKTGSDLIDGLLQGIKDKWAALKAELLSMDKYLPKWMQSNNAKVNVMAEAGKALPVSPMALGGANLSDTPKYYLGGGVPARLVKSPVNAKGHGQTAAIATMTALSLATLSPTMAAPLHPLSLPASEYKATNDSSAVKVNISQAAPAQNIFNIHAASGQSTQDIALVVSNMLDERDRQAQSRANSSFSDRGGFLT